MCAEGAEDAINSLHHEEVDEVSAVRLAVGGASAMLFSCLLACLFLPFLIILIIPAGVFLMAYLAWSLVYSELSSRKAQGLAKKHLGINGKSKLQVIENVGDSSALVLNDWGLVFCTIGKKPVELAWNEITQVQEPEAKVLTVYGNNKTKFKLDLAVAKRFFLVTASMFAKVPRVCDFDINPLTGESCLLSKLRMQPREWKGLWGRFVINADGVQFHDKKIHWDLLQEVDETVVDADPDPGILGKIWTLHFNSVNDSFSVSSSQLENGYELVKRVVSEKCPNRISFVTPAKLPQDIAYEEFCFLQELLDLSAPWTKRRAAVMERYCSYMFTLVKRFKFKFYPQVRKFLESYAGLLRCLNRDEEARVLDEFMPD